MRHPAWSPCSRSNDRGCGWERTTTGRHLMYFTKRLMLAAAGLGCALALTNVAQVLAASPNSRLKGAYAVSIEGNCIYAPGGLNSSNQPENPAKSFLRLL